MAGASEDTRRVDFVNANWTAGPEGGRGSFELQVVTEDGQRRAVTVHPDDVAAVMAMTKGSDVMLFDPDAGTLIAANLAGAWFQADWSAGQTRQAGKAHGR